MEFMANMSALISQPFNQKNFQVFFSFARLLKNTHMRHSVNEKVDFGKRSDQIGECMISSAFTNFCVTLPKCYKKTAINMITVFSRLLMSVGIAH